MQQPRQTQVTKGGSCAHEVIEDIRSEGGTLIAAQCAGCALLIGGYGECSGCGAHKLLRVVTGNKNIRRFCNDDCLKQTRARERKEGKE